MSTSLFWGSVCAVVAAGLWYGRYSQRRAADKKFPGPPADPFIGHVRILPQKDVWLEYTEWGKKYGDIMHIDVLGQTLIFLSKAEDAQALLEKRGANYSDRPRSILQGDIGGFRYFTGFIRYSDDYKTLRRYTTKFFNSNSHVALHPILQDEVKTLLKSLLSNPNGFGTHITRLSAGSVVKTTYGDGFLKSGSDNYITEAAEAVSAVVALGMFGLTPVDLFPILRHLPSWIPGMSSLEDAKKARKMLDKTIDEPYDYVKEQRKSGTDGQCFVDVLLDDYEKDGKTDEHRELLMKNAAGQLYGAGMETTESTIYTFFFEMVRHPEAWKKGRAEIDDVLGTDQLPTLKDRPNLPYVDCILKEVMRINPAVPFSIPHAAMNEDEYKGKIIPKGAIILPNVWAMCRDEQYFKDPEVFNPDRFVSMCTSDEGNTRQLTSFRPNDPSSLIFGFGRRICPGRFMADANMWLTIANVIAAFDILPPIDPKTGKEILPEKRHVGGMGTKLQTFKARIIPRSEKHAQLVRQIS